MPRLSIHHADPTDPGQGWNEHIDYCRQHYPTLAGARAQWGDEVDMDNEHPPYDNDEYLCETCDKPLTERDN